MIMRSPPPITTSILSSFPDHENLSKVITVQVLLLLRSEHVYLFAEELKLPAGYILIDLKRHIYEFLGQLASVLYQIFR